MGKKQIKNEELEQLQKKVTDLENQLKRAVADYQNLEKRVSEGRSELTNFVGAQLIKRLLPVLDHLEQALSGVQSNLATAMSESNGWVKGVELAVKEFKNILLSEGLDEIPADGVFNPSLHEAVDTREGENEMILEVVKKGYNLNGKVLRPAGVVVGRHHSGGEQSEPISEASLRVESNKDPIAQTSSSLQDDSNGEKGN